MGYSQKEIRGLIYASEDRREYLGGWASSDPYVMANLGRWSAPATRPRVRRTPARLPWLPSGSSSRLPQKVTGQPRLVRGTPESGPAKAGVLSVAVPGPGLPAVLFGLRQVAPCQNKPLDDRPSTIGLLIDERLELIVFRQGQATSVSARA